MANLALSLMSVILFCGCCHLFIKSILVKQPRMNATGYNRAALGVQKSYKIFALGTMTMVFLLGLVLSFYEVYVLI